MGKKSFEERSDAQMGKKSFAALLALLALVMGLCPAVAFALDNAVQPAPLQAQDEEGPISFDWMGRETPLFPNESAQVKVNVEGIEGVEGVDWELQLKIGEAGTFDDESQSFKDPLVEGNEYVFDATTKLITLDGGKIFAKYGETFVMMRAKVVSKGTGEQLAIGFEGIGVALPTTDFSDDRFEVRLDGESWKVFALQGKNDTFSLDDLNITLAIYGKEVPADCYDIEIVHQIDWDDEAGQPITEPATEPFGIWKTAEADGGQDWNQGFSNYIVIVKAKDGSGYTGATQGNHFMIYDKFSLNYIGSNPYFGNDPDSYKQVIMPGWFDQFVIPEGDNPELSVLAVDGTKLKANEEYKVTYFVRTEKSFEQAGPEGGLYDVDNPLPGFPEAPGKYAAEIEGLNSYYGGNFFIFDITAAPTASITWKNADGTVLGVDEVALGVVPAYKGATPTKDADAQYTYEFDGWAPAVVAAVDDAVYTAQFKAVKKESSADPTPTQKKQDLQVSAPAKTVKAKKLKKKAQAISPIKVRGQQGTVSYAVAKANAKAKKALKLNATTGKITVKKGTKKGTYKMQVTVNAAGNDQYLAASKTITVKVTVK